MSKVKRGTPTMPCCCESLRTRGGEYVERACTRCEKDKHTECTFEVRSL